MPALDERATRQARAALLQLLEERPEFKDTKNNQIHDLIPFLEIEEDSAEWLPQFESNTRALSTIWHNVIKNGGEVQAEPAPAEPKQNGSAPQPKIEAQVVEAAPAPPKPKPASAPKASAKPAEKPRPEKKAEAQPVPAETVVPVEGEVVEPIHYELIVQSGPRSLAEQTLQASRALAEQFAIVQYHEQMLEQANHTIEELNGALARAKQSQSNATQAYTNSLEDLARLMASSLGPKATDFSKLLARVIGGNQPGKK